MTARRWIKKGLQRYWRLTRSLTMGAQGCVLDADNRVLLVRHRYVPGWHFPGGGVEKSETVEQSLARELQEEAGVELTARAKLFGIYAHHPTFPGDHIALFVVRSWRRPRPSEPNREIAECRFFAASALPPDIHPATAKRIAEILHNRPPAEMW